MSRTIQDLEQRAVLWWPPSLLLRDAAASIVPNLLNTQDDFLSILALSRTSPENVFEILAASKFPGNLFLKHLTVLADYGGEPLQRLGRSFCDIFPLVRNAHCLNYTWAGGPHQYFFSALPCNGLGNAKLQIDAAGLLAPHRLTPLMRDVCMILMHGASSDVADQAGLEKCEIGALIGNDQVLAQYVKQKYICVSRITGGATANRLGQLAQTELVEFLGNALGKSYQVQRNGSIRLPNYAKATGMPFDVVVEKGGSKIGIEVSFQVTTNSTIERKAGQAASRQQLMHAAGYHIAYVLDGAGNFQRSSAISTICSHSDFTVAYEPNEFTLLANWIKEVLK